MLPNCPLSKLEIKEPFGLITLSGIGCAMRLINS